MAAEESLHGSVLVELSHAIELFALAAPPGSPLVVIALLQPAQLERETAVYRDIAARGAVTLVATVDAPPAELPPGVRHTVLGASSELAREWSVTVLGPRAGATLVAIDQEPDDGDARTPREGRPFRGSWSFRRADAYREVLRLRTRLRLPADTCDEIDGVLRAVLDAPEPTDQDWWGVPMRFLAERMDRALADRAVATTALDRATVADDALHDPRTGLYSAAYLDRWTAGPGAGTFEIGLLALRVSGVARLREQYGLRAEHAALAGLRLRIQELVGDADRIIRVGREDFLVVLPSWTAEDVQHLVDEVGARVATLDQAYPFVALPTTVAGLVTRERPLPVALLVARLEPTADVGVEPEVEIDRVAVPT